MFLRKTHVSSLSAFLVRAVQGRQRTRYDRFETEAFIKVRRTCTYTYIWTLIRAIILWILKALGQRVLELLSGNGFHSSGHCDFDLSPTDPKINRGLLLNKGYHSMKFEGSGSKGTQVIEWKRFSLFGSLWPWPLTYWPQNQ